MKYYVIIILLTFTLCKSKSIAVNESKTELTSEDYLIINVFLSQFKTAYLDLSINSISESKSFIAGYEKKVKLFESFEKSCNDGLSSHKELNYKVNFYCSLEYKYRVYKNLFSKQELDFYKNEIENNSKSDYTIDYERILISSIKPFSLEKNINADNLIIKINGIYHNKNKTKVLIKYSIGKKRLYHLIKKENNWWRNIVNFDS
jgi:hypothetical protein